MLNELELEPWVIAEQLRHTDGGRLVLELSRITRFPQV
jgi:hypothetical protein